MKKSQEGKQNGKIIQQGYMVIRTKNQSDRSEEDRGKETGGTACDFLTVREQQTTRTTSGRFFISDFVCRCRSAA